MSFLISILLWAFFFGIATVCKQFVDITSGFYQFYIGCQVIACIIAVIFIIVSVFYQITGINNYYSFLNNIKKLKQNKLAAEKKYNELKEYYEKYFAKIYPDLEKEIFNKISSDTPKDLKKFFQTYPELKSSAIFEKMLSSINKLVSDIYEYEECINSNIRDIDNIITDSWMFIKPKSINQ